MYEYEEEISNTRKGNVKVQHKTKGDEKDPTKHCFIKMQCICCKTQRLSHYLFKIDWSMDCCRVSGHTGLLLYPNNDKQLLSPAASVVLCFCLCAESLNFAADQAEIEIFHGLKKTAAREQRTEVEMEGGQMENGSQTEKM